MVCVFNKEELYRKSSFHTNPWSNPITGSYKDHYCGPSPALYLIQPHLVSIKICFYIIMLLVLRDYLGWGLTEVWRNGFGRVRIHICNPQHSQKMYHSQTADCLNEVSCKKQNSQAWNRVEEKHESAPRSQFSDMQNTVPVLNFLVFAGKMDRITIGFFFFLGFDMI